MAGVGTKALFIDRDGIFNEIVVRDGQMTSPRNWDEIRHFGGLEALSDLKALGFLLIMVTNQPDIERGIIQASFIDELHGYYRELYQLDDVFVCPFADEKSPCKKPNPGMFLEAAEKHAIDLSISFHLGDTVRDTEAARRAGCQSILWDRPYNQGIAADFRVRDLGEVKTILLRSLPAA